MTYEAVTARSAMLRPATAADVEAIATIWQRGWRDGHLGHVPTILLRHREPGYFLERVPARLDTTTVATIDADPVGFVVTHDDEIEQLYVDVSARGSGVADALLQQGETVISARHDRAWLAVVAGNTRARRFYERSGWADTGAFDHLAHATGDTTVSVPALRYEKHLLPSR